MSTKTKKVLIEGCVNDDGIVEITQPIRIMDPIASGEQVKLSEQQLKRTVLDALVGVMLQPKIGIRYESLTHNQLADRLVNWIAPHVVHKPKPPVVQPIGEAVAWQYRLNIPGRESKWFTTDSLTKVGDDFPLQLKVIEVRNLYAPITDGSMAFNKTELRAEDADCADMFLDDHSVPKFDDGKKLSLVGRIMRFKPTDGNGREAAICRTLAVHYAGKDWHKLRALEQEVIALLEEAGYLTVNKPPNGFIGQAVTAPPQSNAGE